MECHSLCLHVVFDEKARESFLEDTSFFLFYGQYTSRVLGLSPWLILIRCDICRVQMDSLEVRVLPNVKHNMYSVQNSKYLEETQWK